MISFVILHYKNTSDTIECLESIKKLKSQKDISIVIVDNNTLNEKDYKKLKKYTNDIIRLENNIGFAKANNIGCKYAKEKYAPDFIAVINNDTLLIDDNFVKDINDLYKKYKFDAYGPAIESPGDSVNPFKTYDRISEINREIKKCNIGLFICKHPFLYRTYHCLINIKHKIIKKKKFEFKNGEEDQLGVSVHGCFIVFSKKYLNKFEDAFFNDTFLYHEEEFLSYRREKYNLTFLYSPKIKIVHKEGQSTASMDEIKKKIFHYQERLKSLKLLADIRK